jgi:hypothetical protein
LHRALLSTDELEARLITTIAASHDTHAYRTFTITCLLTFTIVQTTNSMAMEKTSYALDFPSQRDVDAEKLARRYRNTRERYRRAKKKDRTTGDRVEFHTTKTTFHGNEQQKTQTEYDCEFPAKQATRAERRLYPTTRRALPKQPFTGVSQYDTMFAGDEAEAAVAARNKRGELAKQRRRRAAAAMTTHHGEALQSNTTNGDFAIAGDGQRPPGRARFSAAARPRDLLELDDEDAGTFEDATIYNNCFVAHRVAPFVRHTRVEQPFAKLPFEHQPLNKTDYRAYGPQPRVVVRAEAWQGKTADERTFATEARIVGAEEPRSKSPHVVHHKRRARGKYVPSTQRFDAQSESRARFSVHVNDENFEPARSCKPATKAHVHSHLRFDHISTAQAVEASVVAGEEHPWRRSPTVRRKDHRRRPCKQTDRSIHDVVLQMQPLDAASDDEADVADDAKTETTEALTTNQASARKSRKAVRRRRNQASSQQQVSVDTCCCQCLREAVGNFCTCQTPPKPSSSSTSLLSSPPQRAASAWTVEMVTPTPEAVSTASSVAGKSARARRSKKASTCKQTRKAKAAFKLQGRSQRNLSTANTGLPGPRWV